MPIHSRKNERFRGWNGHLSGYKGSTPAESFVYQASFLHGIHDNSLRTIRFHVCFKTKINSASHDTKIKQCLKNG